MDFTFSDLLKHYFSSRYHISVIFPILFVSVLLMNIDCPFFGKPTFKKLMFCHNTVKLFVVMLQVSKLNEHYPAVLLFYNVRINSGIKKCAVLSGSFRI